MKKLLLITAACLCLTGCATENRVDFYAMDTIMSVTAYGRDSEEAANAVKTRVSELERLWSVTDEGSELYALNHGKSSSVSSETAELVSFALDIAEKSGGALDPTIYPVLTAWGFTTGENHVPSSSELESLKKLVDYRAVSVLEDEILLGDGMMLDLGAVAKGAASDEAAAILRERGISSALINLGGNIMTVGGKPDGGDWRIGVKDPLGEGNIGVLSLRDLAAVSSGIYERFFIAEDGTVYGHIIDPASGAPVDNELLSSTIVSSSGRLCDALSTAVFVLGESKAEALWRALGGFDMLLITKDGEVLITEGLESIFSLTDKSLTVKVIRK